MSATTTDVPSALVTGRYSAQPAHATADTLQYLARCPARLVVVDVETTGLDPHAGAQVSEIAWFSLTSGVGGCFIPAHDLVGASQQALDVSRYAERIAGRVQDDGSELAALNLLLGADGCPTYLVGSNPAFDAAHLSALFFRSELPASPWKHRLIDPAAAAYWLFPTEVEPVGLARACELAGVELDGHHDANVDVRATADLFHALRARL